MKTLYIKGRVVKAVAVALAVMGVALLLVGALLSPVMEVFGPG